MNRKTKTTLIIPAAGKSSRFPSVKPKWMLTHPSGKMMLHESIQNFDMTNVKEVVIGLLSEHVEKYDMEAGLNRKVKPEIETRSGVPVRFVFLKEQTKNQPETVCEIIKSLSIEGPIFIKDVDNQFRHTPLPGNYVTVADINKIDNVSKPASKSYVSYDESGILNNIVEKKIISQYYCTGGYSFLSASNFLNSFLKIRSDNLYVSHLIYDQMLNDKISFRMSEVENVKDWGTIDEWNKYKKRYSTLFLDIDGVIFENTGAYNRLSWGKMPVIKKNAKYLRRIHNEGYSTIILTTSRPEEYRSVTEKSLKENNIPYDQIVFGLPHAQRIVVNDYAPTNPYPSCNAINIERDSCSLEDMLKNLVGV